MKLSRRTIIAAAIAGVIPSLAGREDTVTPPDDSAMPVDPHCTILDETQDFEFFFNKWLSGLGPPRALLT